MARMNNTQFYNASIKKYKKTAMGVHWASAERQLIRFEVFHALLKDELRFSTIVDAGCGFGDFYLYLESKNSLPLEYIGLDSHKKMVSIAKKATKQQVLHGDILRDVLPEADYYFCSGALNILEPFETILSIKQMLRYAHRGVVFNILKGEKDTSSYNKYMPHEMRTLLEFFQGKIEIIEDYLKGDFTVFLRKKDD